MNWKIYYGDGSTFGYRDGSPWRAPGLDVQVIVMDSKDHGWMTQAGCDYYVWDCRAGETRWWGVDKFGLWEYLFITTGHKRVLAGKTTTSERFSEIFKRASEDPDFPNKTSYANKERKA